MPKRAKELSPLEVKRLEHSGNGSNALFAVGGVVGLCLQITPKTGRSWVLRTMVGDKRKEIGLGSYPETSLATARERAKQAKDDIRAGVDPIAKRESLRRGLAAEQARGLSFADAVDRYLAAKLDAFQNEKHRGQWRATLDNYAKPVLGGMLVADIQVGDVLRVLEPIWSSKTETASRLRGRIEAVLSWATVAGHRTGDNPARWAMNLKELLAQPNRVARKENQPALTLGDAPAWFSALRAREGNGARALEFVALTAARSSDVRGALWSEMDLEKRLWIVPALRMKMKREHRVPLSPQAVALLEAMPKQEGQELVFPAPRGGELSDMTLSATMRRMHETELKEGRPGFLDRTSKRPAVPHGLRSTFRDWVAELTTYPGEMSEVALAHQISSAVEAAYRRGDMIEKRRAMMAAWADFLGNVTRSATVVRMA